MSQAPAEANAMNGNAVIRVRGVAVSYGEKRVLGDVAFSVADGEILVIMGKSGCGKTTLLKSLIGLVRADEGEIEILGRNLAAMDEDALDEFRERIGMLFQFGALINSITVGENILLPVMRRCRLDLDAARAAAQVKLAMVGLPDVFDLYPAELSGGMKKRAGFARALILDPDILFFDEPTSGLDPNTAADMDDLILDLNRILKTTMVVVTHDLETAFTVADRIIVMQAGRLVVEGAPEDLRTSSDPLVKSLIERRGAPGRPRAAGEAAQDPDPVRFFI